MFPCSQLPKGPFLPSRCLVNRAMGKEVTSLLRTAIFDVRMRNLMTSTDICPAEIFTRNLVESTHQHIARNIRFMSFSLDRIDVHRNASTMLWSCLTLESGAGALTLSSYGPARIQIDVRHANAVCSVDAPVVNVYAVTSGGTGFECSFSLETCAGF